MIQGKSILFFHYRMLEYDTNAMDMRLHATLRLLKSAGWSITFFPTNRIYTEPYANDLRQEGIEVFCEKISVEEFLHKRANYYDVIFINTLGVATQFFDKVALCSPKSLLVIDFADLESLREARHAELIGDQAKLQEAKKLELKEIEFARKADLIIVRTEIERNILLRKEPSLRVEVIPTICESGREGKSFAERRDLLYLGRFDHLPNVDAVQFMVEEIFPIIRKRLSGIRLIVAGSKMPKIIYDISVEGVKPIGYVKDITQILTSCRILVAPLRYGAGLKGKIVLAMSNGLPVVTTSIGAEGMETAEGKTLLVANKPVEFADSVVRLYTNRRLWSDLSKAGRLYVAHRYSPDIIKPRLLKALEAVPVNMPKRLNQIDNIAREKAEWELDRIRLERDSLLQELDNIRHSLGYKFMKFYASRVDQLSPDGTARGNIRKKIGARLRHMSE